VRPAPEAGPGHVPPPGRRSATEIRAGRVLRPLRRRGVTDRDQQRLHLAGADRGTDAVAATPIRADSASTQYPAAQPPVWFCCVERDSAPGGDA
jgi:hypothetical protein